MCRDICTVILLILSYICMFTFLYGNFYSYFIFLLYTLGLFRLLKFILLFYIHIQP